MQEKRELVDSNAFKMDWCGLAMDMHLLGDWPNTIKPKASKNPTWKVPKERGTRTLIALATKMGRKSESTRGLRRWLLDNRPPSSIADVEQLVARTPLVRFPAPTLTLTLILTLA